jgi:O-acetylserine/cysteine efflux transporter
LRAAVIGRGLGRAAFTTLASPTGRISGCASCVRFSGSLVLEIAIAPRSLTADWHGLGAVAYGPIVETILGYGLWYPLIRKYTVNQVVPYTLLIPALTVGAGDLILGDRLDWQSALGGATMIIGGAMIGRRRMPAAAR